VTIRTFSVIDSPGRLRVGDPWYDYLAIPVAPLLLLVQIGVLFIRPALWRWGISLACTAAITGMFFYVDSRPVAPDEGVNIGAGVLIFWLVVSVALLAVGVAREVVAFTVREFRAENQRKKGRTPL
jgi:cytochrome c biogenesis factor